MAKADVVDLYEEMLYARASRGIRPVLYVSSRKDFECCVLMLLVQPPAELRLTAARRLGQYILRR
jgi:hypothetical protein